MIQTAKKIKCLIVDDEPIARKIIKNYIDQIAFLDFVADCKNGIEAIDILSKNNEIEIVFLDINMPSLNGLSLAKILKNDIHIIFTTAYSEYAVASYDVEAVDYLLKPFSFERFASAVFKAAEKIKNTQLLEKIDQIPEIKKISIKSKGRVYIIDIDTIVYCEAMKNYTKIVLSDGVILKTLATFTKIEAALKSSSVNILRIHRSFIVAIGCVTAVNPNFVFINKIQIPIGQNYKDVVLKTIGFTKFMETTLWDEKNQFQ